MNRAYSTHTVSNEYAASDIMLAILLHDDIIDWRYFV